MEHEKMDLGLWTNAAELEKGCEINSRQRHKGRRFLSIRPALAPLALAFALLLLSGSSLAATYYIDAATGNDANPGTATSPWRTAGHALTAATRGSTIYMSSGNYGSLTLTSNNGRASWADALTFQRKPGQATAPTFSAITFSAAINFWLIFDDVKVHSTTVGNEAGYAVMITDGNYIKFLNCDISGTVGYSGSKPNEDRTTTNIVQLGHASSGGHSFGNIYFEHCEIHDGVRMQINGNWTGPVYFRNNYIHDLGGSHFKLIGGESNGYPTYIENNHIYKQIRMDLGDGSGNNTNDDVHGSAISCRTDYVKIRNNVIHGCGNTSAITLKHDPYDSTQTSHRIATGGYLGMEISNNLLFDIKNNYYILELAFCGPDFKMNNNTIVGSKNDDKSVVWNHREYLNGIWFRNRPTGNPSWANMEFCNNIVACCTASMGGYVKNMGVVHGNHFHSFCEGTTSYSQSWVQTNVAADNWVWGWGGDILSSGNLAAMMLESGNQFFVGPDLHIDEGGNAESHYLQIADHFRPKAGAPSIGAAYASRATVDALTGLDASDRFTTAVLARDADPDAGAYEYGASGTVNQPPVADAGQDQTLNLSDPEGTIAVTLDGSASRDPDGTISSYVWREGTTQLATGSRPTVNLPEGTYTITLTVTDNKGATAVDSVLIAIQAPDLTPPSILSVSASQNTVEVLFNEAVEQASAEKTANYSANNGVIISAAQLAAGNTVILSTSDHAQQTLYTLTVSGVKDISGNAMTSMSMDYQYDAGLAGCWKLDERTGAAVFDSSGNDNVGQLLNSPAWADGKMGGALDFNGSNTSVDCGTDASLDITDSLTIAAWINPRSYGGDGFGRIVDKGNAAAGFSFYLRDASKSLGYTIYGGTPLQSNANTVALNQWQQVAVVHDRSASIVKFYVDGQPAGSVNYTTPPGSALANPLLFGIRGYDASRAFDGLIDDIRVFSRALSDDDILALYNCASEIAFAPIGDKVVNEGANLNFQVITANPEINVVLESHSLPGTPTFVNNIFDWTPTYDNAGAYDATFVASNGQIEDFETITITVNNVNRQPQIAPISNQTVNENQTVSFPVSATDPDGDSLSCHAENLPTGSSFVNQTFSWTPTYQQSGTYLMSFVATDGDLDAVESVAISVSNVNRPPVLDPISNKSVYETQQLSFTLNAEDPDGDSLIYSAQNLPAGALLSGNTFTWTPNLNQAGVYNVVFIVSDGQLSNSRTVGILVNNLVENTAPVLAPIGNKSVDENKTLTFAVTASDADGDPLSFSAQNLPAGATFASRTFTWRPTYDQAGAYNVTITVSDGQITDAETITIIVNDVDNAPPTSNGEAGVWAFDEMSGSSTQDLSANNNTGWLQGPAWCAGVNGGALNFDGLNDYVTCGTDSTLDITGSLTIAAWISPRTMGGSGYGRIVDKGTSSTGFTLFLDKSSGTIAYAIYGGKVVRPRSGSVQLNIWQHVVVTYDNSTHILDFYIDGAMVDSVSYTTPPLSAAASPLIIGMRSYDSSRAFDGCIDDVHVYDKPLTASEISALAALNSGGSNTAPILNPIGNKSLDENDTLGFAITAFDPEGDPIAYSAQNLPAGAALVGNTFSWTPTENQAGLYDVTFTASDGKLQDSETISITVNHVIDPPPSEIIIDNGDPGTSYSGKWSVSAGDECWDNDSLFARNGPTYSFKAAVSGAMDVYAWWTVKSTRSNSVPIEIYDGSKLLGTVVVNQLVNGGQWNHLGTYTFSGQATIKIIAGSGASTCADAVRLAP